MPDQSTINYAFEVKHLQDLLLQNITTLFGNGFVIIFINNRMLIVFYDFEFEFVNLK